MDGAPQKLRTSRLAVASLLLGAASYFLSCFGGIPSVILGAAALWQIKRAEEPMNGVGLAAAGIGLAVVLTTVSVVQGAFFMARQAQSLNNLKQIGLALHTYHDQWKSFPPAFTTDGHGAPLHSWRTVILPYIESHKTEIDYERPWDDAANAELRKMGHSVYSGPLDEDNVDMLMTSYVAVVDPEFIFTGGEGIAFRDISDGPGNTIMVVEVDGTEIPWASPQDMTWNEFLAAYQSESLSAMPDGTFRVMADGGERRLPYGLPPDKLRSLFTRAGGEPEVDLSDH